MVTTKKQLRADLAKEIEENGLLVSDKERLRKENARLKEELRVANLRLDSVFTVSDNAKSCLEQAFGPLSGGFDKVAGVHRYEAAEQLASITFEPKTGKVIMTDPKNAVEGATVLLTPEGQLDVETTWYITQFLDQVAFSRLPRRATRPEGPIDFVRPTLAVVPGDRLTKSDTEAGAAS